MDNRTEEYSTIKLIERAAFSLFPLSSAQNIFYILSVKVNVDPVEYVAYVAWIGQSAQTADQSQRIDPMRMSSDFTDRTRKGALDKLLEHMERQVRLTYGHPPVFPGLGTSTAQTGAPNTGASQNGGNPVHNATSPTHNGASSTASPPNGDTTSVGSQSGGPH